MTLPLRQYKTRSAIPRVRTRPRRTTAIKCRPHISWVLENFHCALMCKNSRSTGAVHECNGRLDPHHTPTKGAGGGDDNVVPLCRRAHTMLDSPGWSEKAVEREYGVEFRPMAAELWEKSPARRVWELKRGDSE